MAKTCQKLSDYRPLLEHIRPAARRRSRSGQTYRWSQCHHQGERYCALWSRHWSSWASRAQRLQSDFDQALPECRWLSTRPERLYWPVRCRRALVALHRPKGRQTTFDCISLARPPKLDRLNRRLNNELNLAPPTSGCWGESASPKVVIV